MVLLCVWTFTSIFGTVVEVKQISTKDRLERKKYMGVCRREPEMEAKMMSRFPSIVTRYMHRKSTNIRGCHSGSSESPRRRNSEVLVSFPGSMWYMSLPGKRKLASLLFVFFSE
jgi:hypothetical protein